mmetsp:Transcript_2562/g.4515  ORF Transcript_2562/g.4515 Transcript_2562/m.4515 type:complete len:365 (+) Transcript_2562:124-1218(+)
MTGWVISLGGFSFCLARGPRASFDVKRSCALSPKTSCARRSCRSSVRWAAEDSTTSNSNLVPTVPGSSRLGGQLALTGATLAWSVNNLGVKMLFARGLTPGVTTAVRFCVVALGFFPFLRLRALFTGFRLSLAAFSGNVCIALALNRTTSGRVSFYSSLSTVFVPFQERLLFGSRGRSINRGQILSIVLCVLGILLLSGVSGAATRTSYIGDAIALASSFAFGMYTVMLSSDDVKKHSPLEFAAGLRTWTFCYALLWLVGENLVLHRSLHGLSAIFQIGTGSFLTLCCLAALLGTASVFQVIGQRLLSPTEAGIIYTIQPVWGAVLGYLFLGEKMSITNLVGAGLVLSGILLAQFSRSSTSTSH